MTDSEWTGAIVSLVTGVLTIYIVAKVLIPQIKSLITEIKPALTGLGKVFKKEEEKAEEEELE